MPKRRMLSSIINLIDNSIYWLSVRWYTPENQINKHLYIGLETIDGFPAIVVADSGTGFSEGDFSELFRPFVSTKPMGVGMGLGLYYVKTAMDSIGGEILICKPNVLKETQKISRLDGAAVALIFKNSEVN